MSIPVELADLRAKSAEYTWAYLLTVRPDATPHLVSLSPEWDGDEILLSVSRGTAENSTAGRTVTLCYPPLDHDGYSLIVDGIAERSDGIVVPEGKHLIRFRPAGAVLHRSAAPGFVNSATGCANDCLAIDGD
ncbi:MAG: pyridoxamine 5'-phosphate oxidase family protein [Ilumatobacter sp.]